MNTDEKRNEATGEPKRRTWLVAASVAAAVLVIGAGGGIALQNAGDDKDSSSSADGKQDNPPPLALEGLAKASGDSGRGGPGIAPGEPNPNGTVYRAAGELPKGPDSGAVYRTSGKVAAEDVTRLAKTLGLEGTPHLNGKTWQIGGNDTDSPRLQVALEAPGSWTFQKFAPPGGDNCPKGKMCASTDWGKNDVVPNEDLAKKKAAPVLRAAGVGKAQLEASELTGASRVVKANPEIGGLPTQGWTTSVNVAFDGSITGGHGYLKTPEKGDSYPLLSAKRTLDELNRTGGTYRSGKGGCAEPVPLGAEEGTDTKGGARLPHDGTDSKDTKDCKPAKPHTSTVKKAVFGLSAQSEKGRQILVPSWHYSVRPEGATSDFTVVHPAIDPRFLAQPSTGAPADRPSPRPTGPNAPLKDAKIEKYTVKGKELTVHFYGSVCKKYSVSAKEEGGKVTVRVTEPAAKPGKVCVQMAKKMDLSVQLDKPLAEREVVTKLGDVVAPK
ncbi:hypothetical protein HUT18_06250 [Streptomyces sp. NA04227]|uniref:hypothetical protein n=1 Tax=Streptomyces sp. NA04227 TaxID=2742136 RepID=UPI0015905BF5|nr:hypothetical protein [Streptomyces sp. NA04227]QKW06061.1 hypothetical protein HUT18_06250 [Streptomyces sp. NA04227]